MYECVTHDMYVRAASESELRGVLLPSSRVSH